MVLTIILLLLSGVVYFLPTLIAWNKTFANQVAVLNFFLGWTFIGWVLALVWAIKHEPKKPNRQEDYSDIDDETIRLARKLRDADISSRNK